MKIGYYKIFDIEHTASNREIKKAFHKLAHKYHPDKPGGDEKQFKIIYSLYEILIDSYKRKEYDKTINFNTSVITSTERLTKEGYRIVQDDQPPGSCDGKPWGYWYSSYKYGR